jgi:bacterioferritin-associated ferredoxin
MLLLTIILIRVYRAAVEGGRHMFVCICQAVTDKQIRHAARGGIRTLDDLGDVLGVATCCGRCGPEACALLEDELDQADRADSERAAA